MKLIDTKTHGYLDYIMGIILIASPSLFNLDTESTPAIVFYAAGATVILYSLLTSYEVGLVKLIPMKIHLILDIISGILLAASPWLFNFADSVYAPHLVLGLIEIGAALVTKPQPRVEINV